MERYKKDERLSVLSYKEERRSWFCVFQASNDLSDRAKSAKLRKDKVYLIA